MTRFWHKCLALIAVAAMTGTANAQWNQQPEIGSYQSILSRAGYGRQQPMNGQAHSGMVNQQQVAPGMQNNGLPMQSMPMQGMQMQGMQNNGMQNNFQSAAPMQGSMTRGNMPGGITQPSMHSQPMMQGQAMATMSNGAMMGPAGGGCATGVGGGFANGAMVSGGMVGGPVMASAPMANYTDCGSSGMGCGPVYSPGANLIGNSRLGAGFGNRVGLSGGQGVNRVGSIFGVILTRNYEDDVRLGYNGAGTEVFSGDIDQGTMSGLGASLITRNCNGSGWEAVYWGIDDDTDYSLPGPSYTDLQGLEDLNHVPSGFNVYDIFNNGTDARFYRDTEINSIAFNLLRNGGQYCTRRGQQANFELLGGFRMFQFDESFRYVSNGTGAYPLTSEYQLQAQNLLLGLQFGGRNEICLNNRWRLATAATVGLFNNHVETRQRIIDETGYSPLLAGGPSAGRPFDYSDEKDDVAFMGEFDCGLIYQLSAKMRARIGYRALGVSGVALAVDQIPYDYNDSYLLQNANSNGSLIMHGVYFGTEYCF